MTFLSRWTRAVALAIVCAAATGSVGAQPTFRVAGLFRDGAVLQRGAQVPVWGWAAPSMEVTVSVRDAIMRARADANGLWRVMLPALQPGNPLEMKVVAGRDSLVVRDLAVGDVWVAAGQSNMEWRLGDATGGAQAVAESNDPQLRFFKVPHAAGEMPYADVPGGSWHAAKPETSGDVSAIGYFMARELRRTQGVPIGVIDVSWSGSAIETWLPREATGLTPAALAAAMDEEQAREARIRDGLRRKLGPLPTSDAGLENGRAMWAEPDLDDADWEAIPVPGAWEGAGYQGLDGVGWYRTSFELTEAESEKPVSLSLGAINDADIVWLNGDEVGRTNGYAEQRTYTLTPRVLRAGRNVLVVRVDDTGGGGGIMGPADRVYLDVGGTRRVLAGPWKFKVGVVAIRNDEQRINKVPTLAFNRMVNPLLQFPVKGVTWYQGESNANTIAQATAYRAQFASLINAWRKGWRTPERTLPFLWVQLTSFGKVDSLPPADAGWATVRESQHAALSLPRTGEVVSFDLGDPNDLHPRNKKDVADRLALVARSVAYGEAIPSAGPSYVSHKVVADSMIVRFDNAGDGLTTRGENARVGGLAITGSDGRWVWADAQIRGSELIVWSASVSRPTALRYAWSNSPVAANLYNRAGLPAAPFRTDR